MLLDSQDPELDLSADRRSTEFEIAWSSQQTEVHEGATTSSPLSALTHGERLALSKRRKECKPTEYQQLMLLSSRLMTHMLSHIDGLAEKEQQGLDHLEKAAEERQKVEDAMYERTTSFLKANLEKQTSLLSEMVQYIGTIANRPPSVCTVVRKQPNPRPSCDHAHPTPDSVVLFSEPLSEEENIVTGQPVKTRPSRKIRKPDIMSL